jgi:hypothetical protein
MRRGQVIGVGLVGLALCAAVAEAATVASKPVPTAQASSRVATIAIARSVAYIGGQFTSLRPAGAAAGTGTIARNHLAAVSLTTGQALTWNPNADRPVLAVAVDGSTAVVVGSFTSIGGKSAGGLAAVSTSTGALLWKATLNREAEAVTIRSGVVYVGGAFTTVNGASHPYLVAFTESTGALRTTWSGSGDGDVTALAVTADGSKVVVGGKFVHLDGRPANHLGALSPTTGAPAAWATHLAYPVAALVANTAGVFAAGGGNGGNFSALDPVSGKLRWHGGTDGNLQAAAAADGVLYLGGHFDYYCAEGSGSHTCSSPIRRSKLLAVDETSGALLPWNPSANSILGVFALSGSGTTLGVGGEFTRIGGVSQQAFAEFHE